MKPLIQKLPLNQSHSFVAERFTTPNFEVGWHQHIEYELILFLEGSGLAFIGTHVGAFQQGDIFFLGSDLPHTFQKKESSTLASAIVVQFREDFWGKDFMNLPEAQALDAFFKASSRGFKINGAGIGELSIFIKELEFASGLRRIILLSRCLEILSIKEHLQTLSAREVTLKPKEAAGIDKIFRFTMDRFREPISLDEVAALACMSVPAFCRYFKRSTKKTYIDFVNQLRVGHACRLLAETNKTISEIGYESGYNTVANFHKQFMKVKNNSPLQYRKSLAQGRTYEGNNIGIQIP